MSYLKHNNTRGIQRYRNTSEFSIKHTNTCTKYLKHRVQTVNDKPITKIRTKHIKENMSELKHYGSRGMRWGHRRYQNEDGSLTELGRIHYGIGDRKVRRQMEKAYIRAHGNTTNSEISDADFKAINTGLNQTRNVAISSAALSRDIARSIEYGNTPKRYLDKPIEQMTDQELNNLINRYSSEDRLRSMTTNSKKEASKKIENTLNIIGDVVAVGASVASIILAIKKLT